MDLAPSAPIWSEPAKSWVEQPWAPETQPAWAPTPVATPWTPTDSPSPLATLLPTVPVISALPPSNGEANNPSSHPKPKTSLSDGIMFGVIFGSFCAIGFVGVLITVIRRKCAARKVKPASRDVEMAAGLVHASMPSPRVAPTQMVVSDAFEPTPVQGRPIVETPERTYYAPQQTHWPPEEV